MPHDLSIASLHAVGFATGAALCALLGLMQLRVDRATGAASGYQILWVVGFIWTLGRFVRYTLLLAGVESDAASLRGAETLAWSCTILGPFAIGRFLQAGLGSATGTARVFMGSATGVSLLNLAMLIWAGSTRSIDASWYPHVSLYVALAVAAAALVVYRVRRPANIVPSRATKPQWFARGIFVLAAVQVTAALLTIRESWLAPELRSALSAISEHWAIPWSIFIAVSLAQIHFADLVLKRSLWLLASISTGVLASVFVFAAPPGLPMLAATLGCAALILVAPYLLRAVHVLVDRVLLDRTNYALAAKGFEEAIQRIYDAQLLFDVALETVRAALHLEARFVLAEEGSAPSTTALASLPVETAYPPRYHLEVSASHRARTLMSQELAFLDVIRVHVSRRLDLIQFEQEQRALHLREERLKRLLTEAELKALRTQVDPHFLFNTLNTIADLIGTNPDQAERMTERLAECFRYALSRQSRDLSTLNDELEFARHYLDIEQVRFGDRLRVHLSRGDAAGTELLPSLLLQPLLENAIRHGLAPVREGGSISVVATHQGDRLQLRVDDDGVGLRPDYGARAGVGLRNVKERLHTLYAKAATFEIRARDGGRGTSVTILVPLHAD